MELMKQAEPITLLNQQNSPLIRLPGELRNMIYAFAFSDNVIEKRDTEHPRTTAQAQPAATDTKKTVPTPLGLLNVSRQIYFECRILIFKLAALRIRDLQHIPDLYRKITDPQWNAITTVRIPMASIQLYCDHCNSPFCPGIDNYAISVRKERLEALSTALGLRRVMIEGYVGTASAISDKLEREDMVRLIQNCVDDQEVDVVFEE